ncbi:MAG: formate--phosphoribosylaminoimidazolecarboxamide ligase family protein [Thermoplasmata archaeon]|uniref:Formate--phosphoribosylaminoimidazolecarboxamide ligase family protein n=1 Tax=Candidatus Sysuiplasma superficiale TaxID=2823368 RepID=A0A8J7YVQ6_9ARCH|nr:formate--phosphoribosylaminoimidazolecarboxamide ligase family protein [Candidatus Sysuiplasma superficiale]MBX8645077.1 formate--phosphoribosylaminoimidazolecarboxamide ligase family protein [Candidatus Sysuiplasma superficiale]MCL4347023.1 formate--phosphoribosylaminoimidazolecarboxamide ligase family protein [Candidatus Thermoplasmatota archaeon]
MMDRNRIRKYVAAYDISSITVGVLGSHSAVDVADGAMQEKLRSLVVVQRGRDATYTRYLRVLRDSDGKVRRGIVDKTIALDRFSEIMNEGSMSLLRENSVIFVPNRSFTSYCSVDDIEDRFAVPMFGSRNLLRSEEREEEDNYYRLLERAGLPFPDEIDAPEEIRELSIVKLHHAEKKLERGFFTASSFEEYRRKSESLIKAHVIDRESLRKARIEKYVIGPVFNLDFFYSPLEDEGEKIELLGIDWRFESSLDGHVRLPADQQLSLSEKQRIPEYTVVGHNSATLRESLLDRAFELAEKYVSATQKYYPPGIIGPFTLQTCVDKDMQFYIYDVAPRIGGGTNAHIWSGHPYGNTLYNRNMSTGRRIAMEIRRAAAEGRIDEIIT